MREHPMGAIKAIGRIHNLNYIFDKSLWISEVLTIIYILSTSGWIMTWYIWRDSHLFDLYLYKAGQGNHSLVPDL